MIYADTAEARFIDRPNRFIAHVELDGRTETVHVKNTGRCRELLLPNIPVVLEKSDNPNRKTKYDLIAVRKKKLGWINIDSQAPNKVVKEWLTKQDFDVVIPEYSYGDSRIDFYMEKGNRKYLLEVKGCTLEIDGTGYFPDAPTVRGVKHIRELMKAQKQGFWCGLLHRSIKASHSSTALFDTI
ncbi:MAG: DNA/RNA nuclease SfsA [Schwartzia sp.]|nr:DNA/RNA nuclease SfsA [Schwartzia sp. (in: firmicutes)]